MAARPKIKFFIDHCVPDSVGRALSGEGHEVILLRTQLAPNSPDPLVAAVSEMNEAVLVSHDADFKSLAPRAGIGRKRFQRLSRIGLKCSEPQAAKRIMAALSLIEHEWQLAQESSDKRMIVEIGATVIRTIR
jgi:predicted nuclease of predicted toxin-antitoxin system